MRPGDRIKYTEKYLRRFKSLEKEYLQAKRGTVKEIDKEQENMVYIHWDNETFVGIATFMGNIEPE